MSAGLRRTSPLRRTRLVLGAVVLAAVAGACIPPGGEPPLGDVDIDLDLDFDGFVECTSGEDPGDPYPLCQDDATLTVTNAGSDPTFAPVTVIARSGTAETGDVTRNTLSNNTCGIVLAPAATCTVQLHSEAHDTELNGVTGRIDVYSGSPTPDFVSFLRTTG